MRQTFIQVTEIWVPSRDRSILEHLGGIYGPHHGFRLAAQNTCFGYDQGLPGRAWALRRPVVLRDLQHSYFRRAEAAQRAGLTCGVALPIFAGDYLLAVVSFFCGSDDDHVGAIELWHHDAEGSSEMRFVDGYFGIAESFEFSARHTTFMRGFGIPGLVWQSGMPLVMNDLGHTQRFLRRDDARRVGINKGLGLPSPYRAGHDYVLTFLSALGTPIARRFEIWVPDERHASLVFQDGLCDIDPQLSARYAALRLEAGWGLLGNVLLTGLPAVSEHIGSEQTPIGSSAAEAGLSALAALPVLENGRLKAVVGLYF